MIRDAEKKVTVSERCILPGDNADTMRSLKVTLDISNSFKKQSQDMSVGILEAPLGVSISKTMPQ